MGREGEREGEKYLCVRDTSTGLSLAHLQLGMWPAIQACALTGNPTSDLSVHKLVLNPLSHTSQGDCQNFDGFKLVS